MGNNDRLPFRRFAPALEAMEARELLSIARPAGAVAASVAPARRSFFAAFTGPFTVGRGLEDSERLRTFVKGNGTSNRFLKGNLKLLISTPADPAQPTTGTATLFDQNYPQTGTQLVLDLSGPTSADGRPTVLTWTVGEGSSGGFSGAQGHGTVELRFHPGGKRPWPALAAGNAGVQFHGDLAANRTASPHGAMEGLGQPH